MIAPSHFRKFLLGNLAMHGLNFGRHGLYSNIFPADPKTQRGGHQSVKACDGHAAQNFPFQQKFALKNVCKTDSRQANF